MVSEFFITTDQKYLPLNICFNCDRFENIDENTLRDYFNSKTKGVKWLSEGKENIIIEYGLKINGYPTTDKKKVIVIYPQDHPKFKAPKNAVIYKDDGTIYMQLKIPELISSAAKERKSRMKNFNPMNDAYFRGVYWGKDGEGNLVTVVSIDFDWEWWESRVLNPETGEFGECVGSGRR